jgi:hypothetical protein
MQLLILINFLLIVYHDLMCFIWVVVAYNVSLQKMEDVCYVYTKYSASLPVIVLTF